jgi:hypothetical protein
MANRRTTPAYYFCQKLLMEIWGSRSLSITGTVLMTPEYAKRHSEIRKASVK